MPLEDHLLDIVKTLKSATESAAQTVQKVLEEIRKEEKPKAAEEVKVNKGGVYTVKDYTGPLFRYKEKIYRKDRGPSPMPIRICGIVGSEWVPGVWVTDIENGDRFLFLEDTEVVAVV